MSIVQEIMLKTTTCGESVRPSEDKVESQCLTCARTATVHLWKTAFGDLLLGRSTPAGGVRFVEKSTIGSNRTGFLVVQTGESVEQAKVFKARAIPQGLCENLTNALKLLSNQQEGGDGLLQNVVTNFGKGSRKGLTDGLHHRALDVGELHRGTGTY